MRKYSTLCFIGQSAHVKYSLDAVVARHSACEKHRSCVLLTQGMRCVCCGEVETSKHLNDLSYIEG